MKLIRWYNLLKPITWHGKRTKRKAEKITKSLFWRKKRENCSTKTKSNLKLKWRQFDWMKEMIAWLRAMCRCWNLQPKPSKYNQSTNHFHFDDWRHHWITDLCSTCKNICFDLNSECSNRNLASRVRSMGFLWIWSRWTQVIITDGIVAATFHAHDNSTW